MVITSSKTPGSVTAGYNSVSFTCTWIALYVPLSVLVKVAAAPIGWLFFVSTLPYTKLCGVIGSQPFAVLIKKENGNDTSLSVGAFPLLLKISVSVMVLIPSCNTNSGDDI